MPAGFLSGNVVWVREFHSWRLLQQWGRVGSSSGVRTAGRSCSGQRSSCGRRALWLKSDSLVSKMFTRSVVEAHLLLLILVMCLSIFCFSLLFVIGDYAFINFLQRINVGFVHFLLFCLLHAVWIFLSLSFIVFFISCLGFNLLFVYQLLTVKTWIIDFKHFFIIYAFKDINVPLITASVTQILICFYFITLPFKILSYFPSDSFSYLFRSKLLNFQVGEVL